MRDGDGCSIIFGIIILMSIVFGFIPYFFEWILGEFGYEFIYKYTSTILSPLLLILTITLSILYGKYSERIFIKIDEKFNSHLIKRLYQDYFQEAQNYSKKIKDFVGTPSDSPKIQQNKFIPPHQGVAPASLLNAIKKKFEETNGNKAEAYKVLTQSHWYNELDTSEQNKITEKGIIDFLFDQVEKFKENKKVINEFQNITNKKNLISLYEKEINDLKETRIKALTTIQYSNEVIQQKI